jgi:hypothetical protein
VERLSFSIHVHDCRQRRNHGDLLIKAQYFIEFQIQAHRRLVEPKDIDSFAVTKTPSIFLIAIHVRSS